MLWFEFPASLPAMYHGVLSSRVSSGSDHMTVKQDQTQGIGHSVVWPRRVVEHRHMTVCSCLHEHDINVNIGKTQDKTLDIKHKLNYINHCNRTLCLRTLHVSSLWSKWALNMLNSTLKFLTLLLTLIDNFSFFNIVHILHYMHISRHSLHPTLW